MEETVIRMAAPTLAGIKTGSLFPYYYKSREELGEEMGRLNRLLIPRGLRLVLLRLTERSALLYLFRPTELEKDLQDCTACELLRGAGYPCTGWGDGEWMRSWEDDCRACGITPACESVLVNGAPEGADAEACVELGKALV